MIIYDSITSNTEAVCSIAVLIFVIPGKNLSWTWGLAILSALLDVIAVVFVIASKRKEGSTRQGESVA